jgi:type IV secretory pathway VirB10-like protein
VKQSDTNGSVATSSNPSTPVSDRISVEQPPANQKPYIPEEAKRKEPLKDKSSVIFVGALIAVVSLLFALTPMLRRSVVRSSKANTINSSKRSVGRPAENATDTGSIVPLTETGQVNRSEADASTVHPEQIGGTANRAQDRTGAPSKLSDIRPFDNHLWEPAPYQPGAENSAKDMAGAPANTVDARSEREAMDKASLVFVRNRSTEAVQVGKTENVSPPVELRLGLSPGVRLRAQLESAVSTAVETPVVAVIEYNYERDGEIVVPAGAKVFGHLESADRSGYVSVRFDSIELPDGSSVNLDAAATDLNLRPLKGRVEGKHSGQNILVRSVAGVGEIATTLVGRGSLNQPLSEADLLRERVSNNIGQASDDAVGRLELTERLVISVPANTEIYVVLKKPVKSVTRGSPTLAQPISRTASIDELRQLLALQRELNQSANVSSSNTQ